MEKCIFILAFFLGDFNLSGLSTTNILRLTNGNDLPVLASKCVCGSCGAPITPFFQLPIISYALCKGKCRKCGAKIPVEGLLLEWVVLAGMFVTQAICSFTYLGVTLSYAFYEAVRIAVVAKKGRRNDGFGKQYAIAVVAMLPYYLVNLFMAWLYNVCV